MMPPKPQKPKPTKILNLLKKIAGLESVSIEKSSIRKSKKKFKKSNKKMIQFWVKVYFCLGTKRYRRQTTKYRFIVIKKIDKARL